MQEADFQTRFGKWLRSEKGAWASGVFELKLARGNRIAWRALEEHQERALLLAAGEVGVYHKLSDVSFGAKPFDCFMVRAVDAWVVVGWIRPNVEHLGVGRSDGRLSGWTMTRVADWVRFRNEKQGAGGYGSASATFEEVKGISTWVEV